MDYSDWFLGGYAVYQMSISQLTLATHDFLGMSDESSPLPGQI